MYDFEFLLDPLLQPEFFNIEQCIRAVDQWYRSAAKLQLTNIVSMFHDVIVLSKQMDFYQTVQVR